PYETRTVIVNPVLLQSGAAIASHVRDPRAMTLASPALVAVKSAATWTVPEHGRSAGSRVTLPGSSTLGAEVLTSHTRAMPGTGPNCSSTLTLTVSPTMAW